MIDPQVPEEVPVALPETQLRQFAGLLVIIFGALFAWSLYRHHGEPTVASVVGLIVALVVGLPGLVHPASIRPVFLTAVVVTHLIGHLVDTHADGLDLDLGMTSDRSKPGFVGGVYTLTYLGIFYFALY